MDKLILGRILEAVSGFPLLEGPVLAVLFLGILLLPLWNTLWSTVALPAQRVKLMMEIRHLSLQSKALMKEKGVSLAPHEEEALTSGYRNLVTAPFATIPGGPAMQRYADTLYFVAIGAGMTCLSLGVSLRVWELAPQQPAWAWARITLFFVALAAGCVLAFFLASLWPRLLRKSWLDLHVKHARLGVVATIAILVGVIVSSFVKAFWT